MIIDIKSFTLSKSYIRCIEIFFGFFKNPQDQVPAINDLIYLFLPDYYVIEASNSAVYVAPSQPPQPLML